jgi:hypothetical protein
MELRRKILRRLCERKKKWRTLIYEIVCDGYFFFHPSDFGFVLDAFPLNAALAILGHPYLSLPINISN